MQVVRRLGRSPVERCASNVACPDLFELSDGRFAVIGIDMTDELAPLRPADAGVGPDERIIVVSRQVLIDAKSGIPEA